MTVDQKILEQDNPLKIIGDAIRVGRKRRKWAQKDLAAFLGVDTSLISKWETYRTTPTGDDLLRVAVELDIVPLLFPHYFPEEEIDRPSLQKEIEDIKKRLDLLEG